ncbi:hypothetical protein [Bradyrhizobium sp. B117]|uniref:hypothetical protein n=1 Tax=Bradyrhizobium sp. B117 TaxID=3140246 RepID=UPI0031844010
MIAIGIAVLAAAVSYLLMGGKDSGAVQAESGVTFQKAADAAGAQVLAFHCGSVPEIVEDGLTGRIVSDVDKAVRAIPPIAATRPQGRPCLFRGTFLLRPHGRGLRPHLPEDASQASDTRLPPSALAARSATLHGQGPRSAAHGPVN